MIRLFIFSLITLCNTAILAQSIDLSLDLDTKNPYRQHMNSKVHIKQSINGQDVEAFAQTQTNLDFKIRKQEGGIYQTDALYTHVQMDMTTTIDGSQMSLGRTKELINQGIEKIINTPFQVSFNTKGKITKVSPMDNIFDRAVKTVVRNNQKTQSVTKFQQEQMLEQLKKSFGAETLTANLETLVAIFPKKRVQVGETWTISSFLSNGMNTLISTQYTLEEITPQYILITGKANIQTDNERITLEQGQTVFFSMSGESTSRIQLDPKSKWIIHAQMTQTIRGTSRTIGDRSHPKGITIPIDTSSEIIIDNL